MAGIMCESTADCTSRLANTTSTLTAICGCLMGMPADYGATCHRGLSPRRHRRRSHHLRRPTLRQHPARFLFFPFDLCRHEHNNMVGLQVGRAHMACLWGQLVSVFALHAFTCMCHQSLFPLVSARRGGHGVISLLGLSVSASSCVHP